MTTAYRNGTGAVRKPFPRQTIILAPVTLPFKGTLAGTIINYNVDAIQALLDNAGAGIHSLNAEFETQEAAVDAERDARWAEIDADDTLDEDTKATLQEQARIQADQQRSPLWLAAARNVIRAAVDSVEWAYDDPPPDPQQPATWAGWPDLIQVWIGQTGLQIAGQQFGIGPLSQQARQLASWSTTASLLKTLKDS